MCCTSQEIGPWSAQTASFKSARWHQMNPKLSSCLLVHRLIHAPMQKFWWISSLRYCTEHRKGTTGRKIVLQHFFLHGVLTHITHTQPQLSEHMFRSSEGRWSQRQKPAVSYLQTSRKISPYAKTFSLRSNCKCSCWNSFVEVSETATY